MMIRIVRYRLLWYIFSLTLIVASCVSVALYGLRIGIDFTGGSLLQLTWTKDRPSADALQSLLQEVGIQNPIIQPVDSNKNLLRFVTITEEQHQRLLDGLTTLGSFIEDRFDTVGPAIGKELQRKALWSIVLIIFAITLYVAWAFRRVSKPVASWKYGVLTIIALLHDVIIPIGVFSVLGKWMGIEVTSTFVVALLTILGYSVNDTIVVFDRIRENISRLGTTLSFDEIIDRSVTQTFSRSMNTTLTTLLALVAIFFFGGDTIKYFSLALIIGIASGAYSSIFVASPLLASWYRWQHT